MALALIVLYLASFIWPAVVLFAGALAVIGCVYLRNQVRRRRIALLDGQLLDESSPANGTQS
jgi:hypothetical protein